MNGKEPRVTNRGNPMEPAMRGIGLVVCCLVLSQSACQRAAPPEKTSRSTSPKPTPAFLEHKHKALAMKRPPLQTAASPPPPDASGIIDTQLKKLAPGRILYNPPKEMKVGVKDRIEVRLSKNQLQDLTQGLQGAGAPKIENLPVGDFMKVRLTGDGFEIAALDSDEQLVADDGFTQWCYDVTPLHSGDRILSLIVTVRIVVPGAPEAVRDYAPFTRTIHVQVNPMYSTARFVEGNWQWLAGTLVIPLALLLWKRLSKRPPDALF